MTLALLLNKKSPDKIQERRNNPSQNKKEEQERRTRNKTKKEETTPRRTRRKNKKEEQERSQERSTEQKPTKEAQEKTQHNNQITVSDEKYIQRKGKRPLIHKFYTARKVQYTRLFSNFLSRC